MLDVRRLKILKAVVESGSVGGAAASLNYTSSAVSQHLAALERETGSVLFERSGRGLRPTDAALLLATHAGKVLGSIQEAEDALIALRSGQSGRIRLAAFPTAGSSVVPGALARFQLAHPGMALDLVVAEVDEALLSLRTGSTEIAVIVLPMGSAEPPSDGLHYVHLLTDPFYVVLPREHRLAGAPTIELSALRDERWIGVDSCPGYCQEVVEASCAAAGFRPNYGLEADEYPTAQGFVAAGLGVALIPLLALGTSVHPGIVVRAVEGARPVREVWAATRVTLAKQAGIAAMLGCLEHSSAEFGAQNASVG